MLEADARIDHRALAELIKAWGAQLGFARIKVSDVDLSEAERHLGDWLARGFHGEMAYMSKHGRWKKRWRKNPATVGLANTPTC